LGVARDLARRLEAPLVSATISRLLVDLNRSPHNPAVFSQITRRLPPPAREALLARFHRPYWQRIRAALDRARVPVLHVSVHSFTPRWRGDVRSFGVGLLYDPSRAAERARAIELQGALRQVAPWLRVRRNAPYRGDSDGLTTAMRRERPEEVYLGIELEINQGLLAEPKSRSKLLEPLAACVRRMLDLEPPDRVLGAGS
jgi:predicted N-formylglutamate amidohydrolase